MKKYGQFVLLLLFMTILLTPVFGTAISKQPVSLDNAFATSSLLPYDFKGYTFVNGELYAYDDAVSYKNYIINGRMMVPIRLLTSFLEDFENNVYWNIGWNFANPKLVSITTSYESKYEVVINVGSKTMKVNGQEIALDSPAEMINNRIVVPLRAICEAVNREVSWINDIAIISKEPTDLASSKTKEVVAKSKVQLSECFQDVNEKFIPMAAYNGGYYALKTYDDGKNEDVTEFLFYKDEKVQEIDLVREPMVINPYYYEKIKPGDDSFYYPTKIGTETKLYKLDFATNSSTEVCSLSEDNVGWSLGKEGCFGGVRKIGESVFVVIHSGDMTMGSDSIYHLENNNLKYVGGAKRLASLTQVGTKLYYTNLDSMGLTENNLKYLDLAK